MGQVSHGEPETSGNHILWEGEPVIMLSSFPGRESLVGMRLHKPWGTSSRPVTAMSGTKACLAETRVSQTKQWPQSNRPRPSACCPPGSHTILWTQPRGLAVLIP